jgi:hypothetical protein
MTSDEQLWEICYDDRYHNNAQKIKRAVENAHFNFPFFNRETR